MKRTAYLIVIVLAFLLGLLHCGVTFVPFRTFSANALWFLGTGFALLFFSGLNFIYVRHKEHRDIRYIARAANLLMFVLVSLSIRVLGIKGNPQVVVLLVVTILMLLLSIAN